MAPIKFEEQLKDKLDKRTLSPSSEGWSKLSDRLDADQNKSKKSLFWWLSIAAGLLIMAAISVQFFNNNDAEEIMPIIVEQQTDETKKENTKEELKDSKSIDIAIEYAIGDSEMNLPVVKASKIIDYKKVANKKPKSKIRVADRTSSNGNMNLTNEVREQKKEFLIITDESMMKEAFANALIDLKAEGTSVTDREIDSLLKLASKELFKDKLQKETSKTVDADALLRSVEEDMGQSFRSKVFDALKESYETVKTAVAERNN